MLPISLAGLGTPFQGGILATLLAILGLIARVWIVGAPERGRVGNETKALTAKIEEDLRGEAAVRLKEFREEVHGLRQELMVAMGKLTIAEAKSVRRGDKLNMLLFILRLVMDELHAKDPTNKVLAQARGLLERVEDEPHQVGGSDALNTAEDTVDAAKATVREIKAEEAKK